MNRNKVSKQNVWEWTVAVVATATVFIGTIWQNIPLAILGALCCCYPLRRMSRFAPRRSDKNSAATGKAVRQAVENKSKQPLFVPQNEKESLVHDLLTGGRSALLLRPQLIENLNDKLLQRTIDALDQDMTLVPGGEVILETQDCVDDESEQVDANIAVMQGQIVYVEPVLLGRHPVTNVQFKQFVDGGGYEDMSIWDEDIWGAMLDFVDRTGHPGPYYWQDGTYPKEKAHHPVVGVSWYEAVAYARWSGMRLPTDAEWIKAGCWPISVSPGTLQQRKYPWGDSMETHRANLWGAGVGETVTVDAFDDGMSVGGLQQMIGNVWEWTSGAYGSSTDISLALPVPMKSLRGGAFDTYFESQATCHFQSGDNPLSRKYNVGFRLALGVCDLAPQAAEFLYGSSEETAPVVAEV